MTPHLFRDAFAYAYLESHPEDYLTLSKILWHRSIKYTLSVYGRNFDESNVSTSGWVVQTEFVRAARCRSSGSCWPRRLFKR